MQFKAASFPARVRSSFQFAIIVLLVGVFLSHSTMSALSPITCNKFEIKASVQDSVLSISLVTDLPDFTGIMVSAYRIYRAGSPSEEYVAIYFQTSSTVKEWRERKTIRLDESECQKRIKDQLNIGDDDGNPLQLKGIDKAITVSVTVHADQPDPRFGSGNSNLVGAKVRSSDFLPVKTVKSEVKVLEPLSPTGESHQAQYVGAANLRAPNSYKLSRQTPLTPGPNPPDPLAAIAQIRQLPPGTRISVMSVDRTKKDHPWYQVQATGPDGKSLGGGWINSTALIGQDVMIVRR